MASSAVNGVADLAERARDALDQDGNGKVDASDIEAAASKAAEKVKEGVSGIADKIGSVFGKK